MSSSEEMIRSLLLLRAEIAAEVAVRMLSLISPRSGVGDSIDSWEMDATDLREIEAINCALLQISGMSWDALAATTEGQVSRQALHRRIAPRADKLRALASAQPGRDFTILNWTLEEVKELLLVLSHDLSGDLETAADAIVRRRNDRAWWADPGRAFDSLLDEEGAANLGGDQLAVRLDYVNHYGAPDDDVVLRLNLPDGMRYIKGTASISTKKPQGWRTLRIGDGAAKKTGLNVAAYLEGENRAFTFSFKMIVDHLNPDVRSDPAWLTRKQIAIVLLNRRRCKVTASQDEDGSQISLYARPPWSD